MSNTKDKGCGHTHYEIHKYHTELIYKLTNFLSQNQLDMLGGNCVDEAIKLIKIAYKVDDNDKAKYVSPCIVCGEDVCEKGVNTCKTCKGEHYDI